MQKIVLIGGRMFRFLCKMHWTQNRRAATPRYRARRTCYEHDGVIMLPYGVFTEFCLCSQRRLCGTLRASAVPVPVKVTWSSHATCRLRLFQDCTERCR